jgi:hypothetical protein
MPDHPIGYKHWFDDELNIRLIPYHHLPSITQTEKGEYPAPRLKVPDGFFYQSNNTLYSTDYFSNNDYRISGINKRASTLVRRLGNTGGS